MNGLRGTYTVKTRYIEQFRATKVGNFKTKKKDHTQAFNLKQSRRGVAAFGWREGRRVVNSLSNINGFDWQMELGEWGGDCKVWMFSRQAISCLQN